MTMGGASVPASRASGNGNDTICLRLTTIPPLLEERAGVRGTGATN